MKFRDGRQIDVAKFLRVWHDLDVPVEAVMEQFAITPGRLREIRKRLGLKPRPKVSDQHPGADDPDEAEILRMAEAIRSKWTPAETERRFVGPRSHAVLARNFVFSSRDWRLEEAPAGF